MQIKIDVTGDELVGITRDIANKMLRRMYLQVGLLWHRKFRPRHFSMKAISRYGYEERTRGYNFRKKKAKGHVIPLVFTGEARVLSTQANIRNTSKGVTITMPALRKLNRRPKTSKVNKSAEMTRVSLDELREVEQFAKRDIERRITRFQRSQGAR